MYGWIVLCIFLCYIIYRATRRIKPKLFYNKNGNIAYLVPQLESLHQYKPTPWLINCHQHTIRGMQIRHRSKVEPRRELFVFSDGGTSALDWFEPLNASADTPIVIVMHTLAGGTREPCSNNFCETIMKHGWKAVVLNGRACSGAPITSAGIFCAIDVSDIDAVVKHVREIFKPKFLFIAGFSLGGYQTLEYGIKVGDVDGIAMVSHTYNALLANECLKVFPQNKLYAPYMMKKLIHLWEKNPYLKKYSQIANVKTLDEYDEILTIKVFKLESVDSYYRQMTCYSKIANIKVPALMLGADDDPFTRERLQPKEEASGSDNLILVTTKEGGHVSFLSGWDGNQSYIDQLIPEWFYTIAKNKNKGEV